MENSQSIQFQTLLNHLPSSHKKFVIKKSTFSVYVAKEIYKSEWNDPVLQQFVIEARKTYHDIIGEGVPLTDIYDNKSGVYLIQVSYILEIPGNKIPVQEWFSMRFIPADGEPTSNEDLEFYSCIIDNQTVPLKELLKKYEEKIITQSRFCAIRPYALYLKDQELLQKWIHKHSHTRNLHTSVSFALMNNCFFEDIEKRNITFQLVTTQMHEIVSHDILSHQSISGKKRLPFIPAYKTLGLKNKTDVKLDRTNPAVYIHAYPNYFFNLESLLQTLKKLINKKIISQKVIENYLYKSTSFDEVLQNPHRHHLRNLGKFLTIQGKIQNENITGEELRALINDEVEDGPTLYLMETEAWKKGVKDFIHFVKNSHDFSFLDIFKNYIIET